AVASESACQFQAQPAAGTGDESALRGKAARENVEGRCHASKDLTNHPAHAASTIKTIPGSSWNAKRRSPSEKATTVLLIALVLKPISTATAAIGTSVCPPAASDAAEMAAACESPSPAKPVAISRPLLTSHFVSAVEIASAAPTIRTNSTAVFGENGRPAGRSCCAVSRTLRKVNSPAYASAVRPDS